MTAARYIAAAALLGIALSSQIGAKSPKSAAGPTPQETVALRQASMVLIAATTGSVKGALERGAPAKAQTFALRGVAKFAEHLPAYFAPSTAGFPGTRAKAEIWSDWAGFKGKAAILAVAAQAAVKAAETDDKAALGAAMTAVTDSCKGCHDAYQLPPPAAKAP
ncbi:MAG: c-type cytochrome [Novosphingobium sp.]